METETTSQETVDGRKPHFMAMFLPNSCSERLEIPLRFNHHIEDKLNEWILLSGHGGKVWRVGLVKLHETFFFNEGWSRFLLDNSVELGDSFVLKYNGDCQFEVYIFDESGCEKEMSECRGECGPKSGKKRGRDEDDVILNNIGRCATKKTASNVCQSSMDLVNGEQCQQSPSAAKPLSLTVYNESRSSNLLTCRSNHLHDPPFPSLWKYQSEQPGTALKYNSNVHKQTLRGKGSKLKFSTSEEKISQSFISDFPHFVRVMKKFNVSGSFTLKIPVTFSMAHLPQCKAKVVLQISEGSCWTVNSIPTTNVHTCHTFCGGWLAFVRANEIEAGDACIFELVSECKMLVHILRVGRQISDCNGEKKSKFRSQVSVSSDIKRLGLGSKNSTRYGYCLPPKMADRKPESNRGSTNPQTRISMSAEEERIAHSFASSFPYFVRIMKKFNVSGSFTVKIPYQFSASHLPGCKTELILRNVKGEPWTVNSVPAANRPTMHTICGGWMAFVRGNNIQLGDTLVFELVGESQLRIHIYRAGTTSVGND